MFIIILVILTIIIIISNDINSKKNCPGLPNVSCDCYRYM